MACIRGSGWRPAPVTSPPGRHLPGGCQNWLCPPTWLRTTRQGTALRLLEEKHHFPLSQDLEFPILELPKFTKSATELTSGPDVWLYFLRHAGTMDTDFLPAALQQPLVVRAVEELKMLCETHVERERFEAPRKAQLDYNTDMNVAREEGEEKGRQEGVIQLCERLLQRPPTPSEQLTGLSVEELTRLADELQAEVLKQGSERSAPAAE